MNILRRVEPDHEKKSQVQSLQGCIATTNKSSNKKCHCNTHAVYVEPLTHKPLFHISAWIMLGVTFRQFLHEKV